MSILEARLEKDDVRGVYTRIAPFYDTWANITEVKARNRALALAAVRDGETLLEVGVGTGLTFAELVRANPHGRNEGIDLTPAMLARAEARVGQVAPGAAYHLQLGDAYALPFQDGELDLVFSTYMLDIFPEADFPRVLGEFARVLKPGGRMLLVNLTKGDRWYHHIPDLLYRASPRMMGGCRAISLEHYVRGVGMELVEREIVWQLGFPSELILAKRSMS